MMGGGYLSAIERAEGLAWARAWRVRNKPVFDAMFGPDRREPRRCRKCGQFVEVTP